MEKELDITSLKNAVSALGTSIETYNEFADKSEKLKDTLRSGVIQNFEVAYELCWKFMKKWMEINVSSTILMETTRREFYKLAKQYGLIGNFEDWWLFHDSRNKTSHIYNGATAEEVYDNALMFLEIAKKFVCDMEKKI